MLDEYGCDIEYVSGSKNVVADALSRLGPAGGEDIEDEEMVTGESSGGPANYAGQIPKAKDADVQGIGSDEVNVIDSDRAPGVQLQKEVETCDEREKMSKEKFREFLEDHPDFGTIQSEDAEVQRIVKILSDADHDSHADISRYYVIDEGLLYRITEPSKCGSYSGLQLVIPNSYRNR